ncbi:MAG: GlsB/YeaQ/YmgE family stress response membrane protein [Hyphomicrobiales bacterium]|nr:MAG: GlsB/YeaQ/YmgE family stress response membrane protein [Hyphomicrobiales bacterium]
MEGVGWIMAIVIGALAGWLAERIMKSDQGLMMNIILGIVGAVVGNFILMLIFGATMGGIVGQLIVAVVGACLLIAIGRAFRGRRSA